MLKRPFVRPLLWWITGIVLQVCFPLQRLSIWLLLPVTFALLHSVFIARRKATFSYRGRWVNGVVFACLLVFFSIQMTALTEIRLSRPSERGWLEQKARETQEYMVEKLDPLRLSDDEKAILATITVNYRLAMSRELRRQFSTIGMSHLLSVSGFHVAIVGGFLVFLFSFFPRRKSFRYLRYVVLITTIWVYTYICGLAAPAVRSAIMFSIYLTGNAMKRYSDKYNTLAIAAFFMLWYNPFYLLDVGFQLSFIGTFSIMYLQPRIYRLIGVRNPLLAYPWNILTVTMAAQVGTIPICSYYFGKTSLICLLTNVYLSFLSILLIPLTLLWMLLPVGLPGCEALQWTIEVLAGSLMWLVNRFSMVPGALVSMNFDFVTTLGTYGILILWIYYSRVRRKWMLFGSLLLLLFLLCRQLVGVFV